MAINFPTVGQAGLDFSNPNSMFAGFQNGQPSVSAGYSAASQKANQQQQGSSIHSNPISGIGRMFNNSSSFAKGLDNFGYQNFGLGTAATGINGGMAGAASGGSGLAAGDMSAALAGETGAISGGLGSMLGGAGFGAMIGGWLGDGGIGSTIGGTLGGAIGAVSGVTSGITMGATLGSIVPGLGTVLGAIGGSLIGGMFGGGGTPHPTSNWRGGMIGADGTISGSKYGAKHISKAVGQSIESDFSKYMGKQAKKYGIEYAQLPVFGGYSVWYDKKKPGTIGVSSNLDYWTEDNGRRATKGHLSDTKTGDDKTKIWSFDPKDQDAKQEAYENAWKYIVQSSGLDPNNLTSVYPEYASEIRINKQTGPSDWDTFLANYKAQQNAQSTATV